MQKNKISKLLLVTFVTMTGFNAVQAAVHTYTPTSIVSSIPPNSLPANIEDNGCNGDGVTVTFNVADSFTVSDVDLGVNILHTWRGDLHMRLSSPITADVFLITDVGGDSDDFSVRFDSDAVSAIPGGDHTIPGAGYQFTSTPETANALNAFDNEVSNGNWVFFVCDNQGQDIGTLESIELFLTDTPSISLVKSVPSNDDADMNNYVSTGDTLSYTVTATNISSSPLTTVVVTDALLTPSSTQCNNVPAAGTCILSGDYLVQGVDELAGSIANVATVDSDQTAALNSNTVITPAGSNEPNLPEDVYYMPLPEADALTSLRSLYSTAQCGNGSNQPNNPVSTYSSITVLRSNTIIYYDHQEDGYEPDSLNQTQGSSVIWGDGNFSNGVAPGSGCGADACDILNAGIIIILENDINTAGPDLVDFDGGDKISATDVIAMTKANWSNGPDTLLAGAFEMYPTTEWGTSYQIPIGEDIYNATNEIYEYVAITVMAHEDGTNVSIDLDGNPATIGDITNIQLDEGESQLIDGGVLVGATVIANNDVQVDIITGDICATYEARFFTLFPTELWDNSYYNPVGTENNDNAPVRVFLYNPTNSDITVLVQDNNSTDTVIVPAGGYNEYRQDESTGAQYCTTINNTTCDENGSPFYAMAAIDSDDSGTSATNDWGFTLVPESSLSQQALVGLGFGQDPDSNGNENSSPVWVTANMVDGTIPNGGDILVCVDYDNDGTDVGTNIDPVTGNEYDVTFNLGLFESQIIYDPDGDQTSMLVWVCDQQDLGRAVLAVAWGQDPDIASNGPPAMDLGTGVPNASALAILKNGLLTNDLNGDGFPSIGDTITYLITVTNVGFVSIDEDFLVDNLPPNVSYVPDSTYFKNDMFNSFTQISDDSVPPELTVFPLDGNGLELPGFVQPEQTLYVSFDVIVDSLPLQDTEVCNTTSVNIPVEVTNDVDCMDLLPRTASIGDFVWNDTDQDGIQDGGEAGIEGVTVTLLDDMGQVVLNGIGNPFTTTTAADGSWLLDNLPEGDYQVQFDTSNTTDGQVYNSTAQNQGNNETVDSDAAPTGAANQAETNTFNLAEGETNNDIDAGFYPVYSEIGDRVWLDLDNDGVQDANEDGIANLIVELDPPAGVDLGAGDGVAITTVTDNNGNYIFTGLPLADGFVVTVSNPPAGLIQSYDEDDGFDNTPNTAHSTIVNLTAPNEEYLTADFGYSPQPGTIGDYVWSDANGDGQQDPGEIGLSNVTVYLCTAANSDPCNAGSTGVITTTTDATGHYAFSGLDQAETYVVQVNTSTLPASYTLTGDPDIVDDNQTTVPPLNTSNGINLDADFGYQPPDAGYFDLGDTLYQDLDGDGIEDLDEPGIPGVTVQLLVGGVPVASVITDNNGDYLFPSLPGGINYTVLITDTQNILDDYVQTADPDGGNDNQSSLILNADNDLQDFGYRPVRSGIGVIGDRIFNDVNSNDIQDSGDQGLEGVVVAIYTQSGDFVGVTSTDENGNYLFTGLDTSETYRVVVDETTLPNGGAGWSNNIDPDGNTSSESIVDLSLIPSGISLDQDFGYEADVVNTIEGTVWSDNDRNGLLTNGPNPTPDETSNGIQNVTVVLTDSNNNIVATTVTDANGNYSFTGLPNGSYSVAVTDKNNMLSGMAHTDGPNAGNNNIDNNSQDDTGYVVNVSGGVTNSTADFGYSPVVTTPITLASFEAVYDKSTGVTTINWTTVTETGNIGFELFTIIDGVWVQVSDKIIPTKGMYKTTASRYQYIYEGEYIKQWAIVDIDIRGKRQSHGAFKTNRAYGKDDSNVNKRTNWQNINSDHQNKLNQRNINKANKINQYIQDNKNKSQNTEGEGS